MSSHATVSPAAASCPQLTYSRWVTMRIQTPASLKSPEGVGRALDHRFELDARMRPSVIAALWSSSNSCLIEPPLPKVPGPFEREATQALTPRRSAQKARKPRVYWAQTPSRSTPKTNGRSSSIAMVSRSSNSASERAGVAARCG